MSDISDDENSPSCEAIHAPAAVRALNFSLHGGASSSSGVFSTNVDMWRMHRDVVLLTHQVQQARKSMKRPDQKCVEGV